MNSLFENSVFAGAFLSLLAYFIGLWLKKRFRYGFLNPMLISIVLCILVLVAGGVDYETYNEGAKYLSYLLTPATVCLAIPMYEQWKLLKKNFRAVMLGLLSGTITSMGTILLLSMLFGLSHEEYVTLLPKSITMAIGMAVSRELGGYVTITVAVIAMTGVLGNMIGVAVCKLFHIEEPISKGLAFGASAHAIGTTRAMELGEVEGAMGGLAIAVSGVLTVLFASFFGGLL